MSPRETLEARVADIRAQIEWNRHMHEHCIDTAEKHYARTSVLRSELDEYEVILAGLETMNQGGAA